MSYSKTFAFLLVTILGYLNVGYFVTESEATLVFDNILQIVGIVGAIWGRYKVGDVTVLGFKK